MTSQFDQFLIGPNGYNLCMISEIRGKKWQDALILLALYLKFTNCQFSLQHNCTPNDIIRHNITS